MSKTYTEHYDCTKLINSLDADGQRPAWYIVCSPERGPGKSYQFSKLLLTDYLENGNKFILLTRNACDLGTSLAEGTLNSYVKSINSPLKDYTISEKIGVRNTYSNIYLTHRDGDDVISEHIGYVVPIRAASKIKSISSLFYDAQSFFFDEFQPVSDRDYLPDEFDKLKTIYESIARGEGKATRYMPIYMSSNTITLQNPYFVNLGLTTKIQSNTKFYRGRGVVFEMVHVEGLVEEHDNSAFGRSLSSVYKTRHKSNMWINDDASLVEKPDNWGRGRYCCTLHAGSDVFGVYAYSNGMRYISRNIDVTCKYDYNLIVNGSYNRPALMTTPMLQQLRTEFYKGLIRCSDAGVQKVLIDVFA